MVRDTSVVAFCEVMESGHVSRRRREVYESLYENGPCTAQELFRCMARKRASANSNVVTRLGELREQGLVEELGSKVCDVTGKSVILWDVTSKLPKKLVKKPRRTWWVILDESGKALAVYNSREGAHRAELNDSLELVEVVARR